MKPLLYSYPVNVTFTSYHAITIFNILEVYVIYMVELPIDKVHEVLTVQLSCKCDLYLGTVDVVH